MEIQYWVQGIFEVSVGITNKSVAVVIDSESLLPVRSLYGV